MVINPPGDEDLAAHLEDLASQAFNLARATERAVHRARLAGWTWRRIGAALGVSHTTAHERYRFLASSGAPDGAPWMEPPLPLAGDSTTQAP